jgi:hypothetical protein
MAIRRARRRHANHVTESPAERPPGRPDWAHRAACAALVILPGVAYLATLYPGVGSGDTAELQVMCPLLGVCHPPGYATEVVAGKLFSLLPIGPNVAWRISLMQAVCGVVGCLAMYGLVRRLTGQVLPALIAATTLAFSVTYWLHSARAEVYVFYGMFLLLGVYAAVRWLTSDRSAWLYLTALFLGICICSRPSELLVLPGLVGLWLGFHRKVHLTVGRGVACVLIAVSPFVFAVGYYMVREDPALLHARDNGLRDEILGVGPPRAEQSFSQRLGEAVSYSLGLAASQRAKFTEFTGVQLAWDLKKYGWLVSGAGAFRDRFPKGDPMLERNRYLLWREQGRGTSIGALGVLLALTGLRRWRRQWSTVLLGSGMFLGNLAFYLYLHPVDNLHFTIPGWAGLAVLIGLGASTSTEPRGRRAPLVYQVACFAVPAFLLVTNYRFVHPMTPDTREHLELGERVKETPLPAKPAIIATYSRAHTLRCLYWVDAGRTDVNVIIYRERFEGDALLRMVRGLTRRGHSVLLSTEGITDLKKKRLVASWTPYELISIGLFWAYPPGAPPFD